MPYKLISVFLLSAVPLIEQRGAIPLGFVYQINPLVIFVVALAGSLLPVTAIYFLFNKTYEFLSKFPKLGRLVNLIDKKIEKNQKHFEKYGELALITFIAIPLPTTGLWTGSAIAAFLKFDFKKTIICAFVGATLSAAIITMLCIWLPELFTK